MLDNKEEIHKDKCTCYNCSNPGERAARKEAAKLSKKQYTEPMTQYKNLVAEVLAAKAHANTLSRAFPKTAEGIILNSGVSAILDNLKDHVWVSSGREASDNERVKTVFKLESHCLFCDTTWYGVTIKFNIKGLLKIYTTASDVGGEIMVRTSTVNRVEYPSSFTLTFQQCSQNLIHSIKHHHKYRQLFNKAIGAKKLNKLRGALDNLKDCADDILTLKKGVKDE